MPPASLHARAVHAAIEAMDGTLAIAQALAGARRRIELAGLEREAAAICAALMALRPEEARALRPPLEALLHRLDGLAASLAPA